MAGGSPCWASTLEELVNSNKISEAIDILEANSDDVTRDPASFLRIISRFRQMHYTTLYSSIYFGYIDGVLGKIIPFSHLHLLLTDQRKSVSGGFVMVSLLLLFLVGLSSAHTENDKGSQILSVKEFYDLRSNILNESEYILNFNSYAKENKGCYSHEATNVITDDFPLIRDLSGLFKNESFVVDTDEPQNFLVYLTNKKCFYSYQTSTIQFLSIFKGMRKDAMQLFFKKDCLFFGAQSGNQILSKIKVEVGNFLTCGLLCLEQTNCNSYTFVFQQSLCLTYKNKADNIIENNKVLTLNKNCVPLNVKLPQLNMKTVLKPVTSECSWRQSPPKMLSYKCADTFNILKSKFDVLINCLQKLITYFEKMTGRSKRRSKNQLALIPFLNSLLPINMPHQPTSRTKPVQMLEQFIFNQTIHLQNRIKVLLENVILSKFDKFHFEDKSLFPVSRRKLTLETQSQTPCLQSQCLTTNVTSPKNTNQYFDQTFNQQSQEYNHDLIQYGLLGTVTFLVILSWILVFVYKRCKINQDPTLIRYSQPELNEQKSEDIYQEIKRPLPFLKAK